jgi:hypothetical protein
MLLPSDSEVSICTPPFDFLALDPNTRVRYSRLLKSLRDKGFPDTTARSGITKSRVANSELFGALVKLAQERLHRIDSKSSYIEYLDVVLSEYHELYPVWNSIRQKKKQDDPEVNQVNKKQMAENFEFLIEDLKRQILDGSEFRHMLADLKSLIERLYQASWQYLPAQQQHQMLKTTMLGCEMNFLSGACGYLGEGLVASNSTISDSFNPVAWLEPQNGLSLLLQSGSSALRQKKSLDGRGYRAFIFQGSYTFTYTETLQLLETFRHQLYGGMNAGFLKMSDLPELPYHNLASFGKKVVFAADGILSRWQIKVGKEAEEYRAYVSNVIDKTPLFFTIDDLRDPQFHKRFEKQVINILCG